VIGRNSAGTNFSNYIEILHLIIECVQNRITGQPKFDLYGMAVNPFLFIQLSIGIHSQISKKYSGSINRLLTMFKQI